MNCPLCTFKSGDSSITLLTHLRTAHRLNLHVALDYYKEAFTNEMHARYDATFDT